MKRIPVNHGSARVSRNINQETIYLLNKMAESVYKMTQTKTRPMKEIEPNLIKAGDSRVNLGIPGVPPLVDCRVVSEELYQKMKKAFDPNGTKFRNL